MKQTVIDFIESENKEQAEALYAYWKTRPQVDAIMIGPSKFLSNAGIQFQGIEAGKEYYLVMGSTADSKADPSIGP